MREKDAATVTINNAGEMTNKQRQEIAAWLKQQADDLIVDGRDYDTKFTGHYRGAR